MGKLAKVTDVLSEAGRAVMNRGFAEGRTAAFIAQAVLDATGEELATRTVARRAAEWRAERDRRASARERMEDLVGALRKGDASASDMVQALAMQALVDDPDAFTGESAIKVQRAGLAAEELRLKRRALEIKERGMAVLEKRLGLLEEREARVRAAVEGEKGVAMSAEERLAAVRGIFGLS